MTLQQTQLPTIFSRLKLELDTGATRTCEEVQHISAAGSGDQGEPAMEGGTPRHLLLPRLTSVKDMLHGVPSVVLQQKTPQSSSPKKHYSRITQ